MTDTSAQPPPAGGDPWSSLWWPGDHRAGEVMSDVALWDALVVVEQAWLDALVEHGVAPAAARADLADTAADLAAHLRRDPGAAQDFARAAERGGNPVIPLLAELRERLPDASATWLHRGLTSQDVIDSALVLCARATRAPVRQALGRQAARLAGLAEEHRGSTMVARTLTQPAVPTTFGLKAAGWLHQVLDADEALAGLPTPIQLGGAAGTLSGLVELAGPDRARDLRRDLASRLGLEPAAPWHTRRVPWTRWGDATVAACDAWGRIATDVLTLGRPEIGELRDASAGGSSAMPHKANPTLAVLVRRAALSAPPLAATLHSAAALQVDERADGAWHAEWQTLALLLRRAVVAGGQVTELLDGLVVDTERMAAHVRDHADALTSEQRALAAVAGHEPREAPVGLADELVDEALARHRQIEEQTS